MLERRSIRYETDKIISGDYQVPASDILQLTGDDKISEKIAKNRRGIVYSAGLDLFGKAVALYGLESSDTKYFVAGGTLTALGAFFKQRKQNETGGDLGRVVQDVIDGLNEHKGPINAALINNGISPEEVDALGQLPDQLYTSQFFFTKRASNTLGPVSLAAVMAPYDIIPAAVLAALGLASVPAGNFIHRKDNKRTAKKIAGRSAKHSAYIEHSLEEHYRNTSISNSLARIPEGAAMGRLASGINHSNIATFYAMLRGLNSLTDVMGEQRERDKAKRTKDVADIVIKTLCEKPLIATPERWQEHVSEAGIDIFTGTEPPFEKGIIIKDFVPYSPSGELTNLKPLNVAVPGNGAAIMQAESGTGKSVTLMALMHLFEHRGSVHLIKDNAVTDVHKLSGPQEVAQHIVLMTENKIDAKGRITDIFKEYFRSEQAELYESHLERQRDRAKAARFKFRAKFKPMDVEVAWLLADNILESEIKKIDKKKEESIFPKEMKEDLLELREKRTEWINTYLSNRPGNISNITADRVFTTLSEGEKRRMVVEKAYMESKYKEPVAVILDEPLANLDPENKGFQLDTLKQMQEENGTALLIVSHDSLQDLRKQLHNCEIVRLEKNTPEEPPVANS